MSELNRLGFDKKSYEGSKSTLCTGCGHDNVTSHIVTALYQSSVDPYSVAKMSGIGCSSKTPAYFLGKSHGFNSLHGRMAPVATGARIANRQLTVLGVSGDGDTASIGLGGFAHLIRRNLPMIYIIENNGVYGLTKGQFSATADPGSTQKHGEVNAFSSIDVCSLAIDLGCGFVARSFSGDAKQLVPLLSAALRHPGTAVIDVVSPCITFANHDGSTKSFEAVKASKVNLQEFGFIQPQQPINVDYAEGTTTEVKLPDGSTLLLKKIEGRTHDVKDRAEALKLLFQSRSRGEILTGLFILDEKSKPLEETMHLPKKPLRDLQKQELAPTAHELQAALDQFR